MSIRKMKLKDYGITPGRAAELKEMVKDRQYYFLVMRERLSHNISENTGVWE